MQVETDEPEIIERVAALDVSKAEVVCCARVPGPGRQRMQEVRTVSTMTAALLGLGDWLAGLGVTRVVMEATSDYWRAPFYLLEDRFETWLVNAHDVKHLPGRPKTDRLDAVWLCKVAERQMLRPSFVPPPAIRQLRDLTRYRVDLLAVRTAEKQRVEKLLEDALIKLSVVVSDPFGISGRAMMAALIAGERDPAVLAEMARGSMRSKTARLTESLTGRFTEHHAFLLTQMLQRVDAATADIATVQARIEARIGELGPAVARLDAIPGIGPVAAQMILAEIGTDMGRFPTPGHLTSWARFAPGVSESAGRPTGNSGTGKGNRYLARVVGEAAVSAARTDTFLGERYRRIARRRGKKRAIVAVGRSILVIVWALLSDDEAQFVDLGPDFYTARTNPERKVRQHIRELQALGYAVTLNPA
ncbi:IS110 family transposase [Blastococcus sp. CT_GayMR19]|uniref:IS110 family transposase n=1 Tax=Blastococcus sp. CT_GayMR19 TaxID=2559608 RepID=UPI0010739808|nr:IS110 family transposase [Blastococcus sp. CT_GayMR19]TFV78491.1 IS110 family transposase [Blastococcus sp. CT_GayMR19]